MEGFINTGWIAGTLTSILASMIGAYFFQSINKIFEVKKNIFEPDVCPEECTCVCPGQEEDQDIVTKENGDWIIQNMGTVMMFVLLTLFAISAILISQKNPIP